MRMMKIDDSSNVAAVGYDLAAATLRIKFHGGGLYDYPEITPVQFADLACADSVGRWVHTELVKPHRKFIPQTEVRDATTPVDLAVRYRTALEMIATKAPVCGSCATLVDAAKAALA